MLVDYVNTFMAYFCATLIKSQPTVAVTTDLAFAHRLYSQHNLNYLTVGHNVKKNKVNDF